MLSSTFVDEFGYLNLKPEQSNIFFKLMEERYNRRPSIITSNLSPRNLGEHLGDRTMHRIAELAQVVSLADCPDLRAQSRKPRLVKKDENVA